MRRKGRRHNTTRRKATCARVGARRKFLDWQEKCGLEMDKHGYSAEDLPMSRRLRLTTAKHYSLSIRFRCVTRQFFPRRFRVPPAHTAELKPLTFLSPSPTLCPRWLAETTGNCNEISSGALVDVSLRSPSTSKKLPILESTQNGAVFQTFVGCCSVKSAKICRAFSSDSHHAFSVATFCSCKVPRATRSASAMSRAEKIDGR